MQGPPSKIKIVPPSLPTIRRGFPFSGILFKLLDETELDAIVKTPISFTITLNRADSDQNGAPLKASCIHHRLCQNSYRLTTVDKITRTEDVNKSQFEIMDLLVEEDYEGPAVLTIKESDAQAIENPLHLLEDSMTLQVKSGVPARVQVKSHHNIEISNGEAPSPIIIHILDKYGTYVNDDTTTQVRIVSESPDIPLDGQWNTVNNGECNFVFNQAIRIQADRLPKSYKLKISARIPTAMPAAPSTNATSISARRKRKNNWPMVEFEVQRNSLCIYLFRTLLCN
jgi:hypothetical protein